MEKVIEIQDLSRLYELKSGTVRALQNVTFSVDRGELAAVMGPSGSGKSTLMNMLGCLDRPTSGTYRLEGEDVSQLSDDRLAAIRNRHIGFIFQNFNLLQRTSALSNCELPLVYSGVSAGERRARAVAALEAVGLGERMHHRPNELSGGQQQRVAIARALVNRPSIILADEPTGNLDSQSGVEIIRMLQDLNANQGITILIVTHDPFIARHTRRVVRVQDGTIVSDEKVARPLAAGETPRPSEAAMGMEA